MRTRITIATLSFVCLLFVACSSPAPPTAIASPRPTATPTPRPTATASPRPTATQISTPVTIVITPVIPDLDTGAVLSRSLAALTVLEPYAFQYDQDGAVDWSTLSASDRSVFDASPDNILSGLVACETFTIRQPSMTPTQYDAIQRQCTELREARDRLTSGGGFGVFPAGEPLRGLLFEYRIKDKPPEERLWQRLLYHTTSPENVTIIIGATALTVATGGATAPILAKAVLIPIGLDASREFTYVLREEGALTPEQASTANTVISVVGLISSLKGATAATQTKLTLPTITSEIALVGWNLKSSVDEGQGRFRVVVETEDGDIEFEVQDYVPDELVYVTVNGSTYDSAQVDHVANTATWLVSGGSVTIYPLPYTDEGGYIPGTTVTVVPTGNISCSTGGNTLLRLHESSTLNGNGWVNCDPSGSGGGNDEFFTLSITSMYNGTTVIWMSNTQLCLVEGICVQVIPAPEKLEDHNGDYWTTGKYREGTTVTIIPHAASSDACLVDGEWEFGSFSVQMTSDRVIRCEGSWV